MGNQYKDEADYYPIDEEPKTNQEEEEVAIKPNRQDEQDDEPLTNNILSYNLDEYGNLEVTYEKETIIIEKGKLFDFLKWQLGQR